MRISDTGSTSKTSETKKKKSVGNSGTGGIFSIDNGSEEVKVEQPPSIQNIGNIQSVLSINSLEILSRASDEEYNRSENLNWGKDVLEQMEQIKYQILNGKISYNALLSLQERLNNIPINPQDHKLREIINDIEIRAAVEIEKYKKYTSSEDLLT